MCILEIAKDNAFNSVHATVFGKNLLEFKDESGKIFHSSNSGQDISSQIEYVIKKKLESIGNFKAQYISFHMRRNALTCLENSPLATRILKPQTLSINYISVTGYNLNNVKGKYADLVNKGQKKSAMEIMSFVCQGEFSSALKVLSNQKETIDKIKEQFDFLASLATKNANISIEPIFIKISTYNKEMGDWIIKRLIAKEGSPANASLTGKLIISDLSMVPGRLDLLLQSIIERLAKAAGMASGSSLQMTEISDLREFAAIYTRTLRYAASAFKKDKTEIDLAVTKDQFLTLISLLSVNKDTVSVANTKTIREFILLLLVPPTPFTNSKVSQVDFATEHLLIAGDDDLANVKQEIACYLACQNHEIAMKIF